MLRYAHDSSTCMKTPSEEIFGRSTIRWFPIDG